ncbi:hypothetical protein PHMEG_0003138 [Phytophthora megakarya]|uniref:Uncharacterized protein n=1 Tax=Phytophthora megakarya TaxID=4795 RepID=A0A225WZ96_9STRA|nr:hypothetical protein PHMEG_0003138 [Phytophthora megakarya]
MNENADAKDSASPKKKDKKHKIEKPKVKKTRRHFREELQRRDQVPQADTKPDIDQNEIVQTDSSLSPSAIVEMFHLQEENSSSTSTGTIARYLVEHETSGDFYQIRSKQRKQHLHFPDHVRHRRSLMKAQQKFRDGSTKAENSMCCTILQRDGEKALVVMLLGIVTGMCWMDALNLHLDNASSSRSKFDSFVCAYSAGSNRSRHNFFVLFKYPSHGIVS